jgi:hypothetical protein
MYTKISTFIFLIKTLKKTGKKIIKTLLKTLKWRKYGKDTL